jgi:hypothetical protein
LQGTAHQLHVLRQVSCLHDISLGTGAWPAACWLDHTGLTI